MNTPNITLTCNKTKLESSVDCLVNNVRDWYYFNMSNQKNILNDNELKEQGGVCWHYAEWYKNQFMAFGFGAKTITIDSNEDWTGHRITLVYNYEHSTYCIIDQRNYQCFYTIPMSMKELDSLKSVNKTL